MNKCKVSTKQTGRQKDLKKNQTNRKNTYKQTRQTEQGQIDKTGGTQTNRPNTNKADRRQNKHKTDVTDEQTES